MVGSQAMEAKIRPGGLVGGDCWVQVVPAWARADGSGRRNEAATARDTARAARPRARLGRLAEPKPGQPDKARRHDAIEAPPVSPSQLLFLPTPARVNRPCPLSTKAPKPPRIRSPTAPTCTPSSDPRQEHGSQGLRVRTGVAEH